MGVKFIIVKDGGDYLGRVYQEAVNPEVRLRILLQHGYLKSIM